VEGQKTLLDALFPVCRAFASYHSSGTLDLNALVSLLATAAAEGMHASE
jgi:hypothetical protein